MDAPNADVRLEQQIAEVRTLLARHGLLESVARRQETPRSALLEEMQRRENLVELEVRLRSFHPANIARILESVPTEDRAIVWSQLQPVVAGQALVEVSPSIRESLIEATPSTRLFAILSELDVDDLRSLSESVPDAMLAELSAVLDARDRTWVEDSRSFPEGSAARLMTQDVLSLPIAGTVEDAVSRVRQLDADAPVRERRCRFDAGVFDVRKYVRR